MKETLVGWIMMFHLLLLYDLKNIIDLMKNKVIAELGPDLASLRGECTIMPPYTGVSRSFLFDGHVVGFMLFMLIRCPVAFVDSVIFHYLHVLNIVAFVIGFHCFSFLL